MSTPTRNSPASGVADLSGKAENNRPAAGVEVPVIVHASRYSAASSSVGKALPAVHEETNTVIVLEQGAVVRLTALMVVGEVVVLTNKKTGADVICKVSNVKTQPGIQNYVSLEFTQRAPGFWGESAPPTTGAPASKPASSSVPLPAPAPLAAESSPAAAHITPTVPAVPAPLAPPPQPVAAAHFEPEPVASAIAEPVEPASSAPAFAASSGKKFTAGSTLGIGDASASVVPSNLRPIEFAGPSTAQSTEGKNLTLVAIAAAALLVVGGMGGWLLLGPRKQPAASAQAPRNSEAAALPAGTPSQADAPTQPASTSDPLDTPSSATAPVEPLNASTRTSAAPEPAALQPAVSRSSNEITISSSSSGAAALPASKTAAPVAPPPVERRPEIDVTKMRAPSVKKASGATSIEAPPELQAQTPGLPGNSLNDGLFSPSRAGLSAPVSPPASRGGQLTQPKLVSAPSAIYPPLARADLVQGDVLVDAFIDENGRVIATKVISGPAELQQSAMTAVRTWTYQPARLDGQPISIHTRVTVSFRLK